MRLSGKPRTRSGLPRRPSGQGSGTTRRYALASNGIMAFEVLGEAVPAAGLCVVRCCEQDRNVEAPQEVHARPLTDLFHEFRALEEHLSADISGLPCRKPPSRAAT